MFISNEERIQLKADVSALRKIVGDMSAEIVYLVARVKVLSGVKDKPKHKLTDAQRAKQREYSKRYQAKKRMEDKNAISISAKSI
jgi:hypothetical protein